LSSTAAATDQTALSAVDLVVSVAPLCASINLLRKLASSDEAGPFWQNPTWWQLANEHLFSNELQLITVSNATHDVIAAFPVEQLGGQIYSPQHQHLTVSDAYWNAPVTSECVNEVMSVVLNQLDAWSWEIGNAPNTSVLCLCKEKEDWEWHRVRNSAWFDTTGEVPIPGKLRRNLARQERHLLDDGDLTFSVISAVDAYDITVHIEEFLQLEAAGWKGESGTAINHDPELRGFYKSMQTLATDDLQLEVHKLTHKGACIASQMAVRCGNVRYLLKIAYDESYASRSPGALLLWHTLKHCAADDTDRLSLVSAPDWAARWHPNEFPVWRIARFANGVQGSLRQQAYRLRKGVTQQLRVTRNRMRP